MRLWTVHPRHLDAKGLVALWREALLAKHVLQGRTKGYKHHPQLARFRAHPKPIAAINAYLADLFAEATARGYSFDRSKFRAPAKGAVARIAETRGQLAYEWAHLLKKLRVRDAARFNAARAVKRPSAHPLFRIVAGGVRDWERTGG